MALNPDIRDQAYQFFIEEAPELLQAIEAGLLTLRSERSTAKVHTIMRAAHSLKGGAASVELKAIATLAHRLEHIFKALYDETIDIDTDLESQLLQAYDCLRLPLIEQIRSGELDAEQALSLAEPIFAQIEERLGEALSQGDTYIPSSSELGIDMALSIFEVDVAQGLEHLARVVAHPNDYEVAGELRAQVEVFLGFAELLNQPGFGAIAETARRAVDAHPESALEITQLALTDFHRARDVVLAATSNTTDTVQALHPCPALVAFANSTTTLISESTSLASVEAVDDTPALLEDVFDHTIGPESFEFPILSQDWETSSLGTPEIAPSNQDELVPTAEALETIELTLADWELEEAIAASPEYQKEWHIVAETLGDTPTVEADQEFEVTITSASEAVMNDTAITCEVDTNLHESDSPDLDLQWVAHATSQTTDVTEEALLLDVVGKTVSAFETQAKEVEDVEDVEAVETHSPPTPSPLVSKTLLTLEQAVQSIEQIFDHLPSLQQERQMADGRWQMVSPSVDSPRLLDFGVSAQSNTTDKEQGLESPSEKNLLPPASFLLPSELSGSQSNELSLPATNGRQSDASPTSNRSVRVDSERLERINNLVGELAINRNGLSLHNEQLQGSVRELLNRFVRVQNLVGNLRELSDQLLIAPERFGDGRLPRSLTQLKVLSSIQADFDSLELDNYGVLHSRLQELLEDMMQLEEAVDDIVLFARASNQTLEQQRQMLTQLRDELMWARMLPLGEVFNRFPRMLRDLSTTYNKPVSLKLSGTSVLVDKAVLEKLYDPLLHLLRNAFDHGIEFPDIRRQQGKPEQGQIEIKAYHHGSQTVIEVKDDGQGLNIERIRQRALELELLSSEQLATISNSHLYELIFEPGFSTASQVSQLSGRGVGLDVVRAQMRSLKGTISVTSSPGVGTTFILSLPLTLTIAKLLVCFIGPTALALPSDSVEEIIVPKAGQMKESGIQRFLQWRGQLISTYRLADLLEFNCPLVDTSPSTALFAVPSPQEWALPMLILRQGQRVIALEIDRLVTEQELVIKPFGAAIASPSCTYGCTILGDGTLVPVLDTTILLEQILGQKSATAESNVRHLMTFPEETHPNSQLSSASLATDEGASIIKTVPVIKTHRAPTVLVVDDAAALRRTLALTLERAGYRVLQARDGREAIEQLQQSLGIWSSPLLREHGLTNATLTVNLVICDIEMPNMNGFEFLNARRQDLQLANIPVVMLTSRSNEKHRRLAMQLGATAYFTKPYLEQEFLGSIEHILAQSTSALQPNL